MKTNYLNLPAEQRVEKFDALLFELESQVVEIRKLTKILKNTQAKTKQIMEYYSSYWMEDYEKFKDREGLHVLGEDYIDDFYTNFKAEEKEILLTIAKNI